MHDGMPYGRNQGQGQGHSREVDRHSATGLIFLFVTSAKSLQAAVVTAWSDFISGGHTVVEGSCAVWTWCLRPVDVRGRHAADSAGVAAVGGSSVSRRLIGGIRRRIHRRREVGPWLVLVHGSRLRATRFHPSSCRPAVFTSRVPISVWRTIGLLCRNHHCTFSPHSISLEFLTSIQADFF